MRFDQKRVTAIILLFGFILANFPCFALTKEYKYPFDEYSRDPLYPLISKSGQIIIPKEAAIADFVLQGVIFSEDGSRAVISNEIVKEGDNVRGYTVLQREEKEVVHGKGEDKFTLKLEGE